MIRRGKIVTIWRAVPSFSLAGCAAGLVNSPATSAVSLPNDEIIRIADVSVRPVWLTGGITLSSGALGSSALSRTSAGIASAPSGPLAAPAATAAAASAATLRAGARGIALTNAMRATDVGSFDTPWFGGAAVVALAAGGGVAG